MLPGLNCVELGIITRRHGLKGQLVVQLIHQSGVENLKEAESIFIEIDGLLIPFFIEEFNPHARNPLIKFVDVEDEKFIKRLENCKLWIDVNNNFIESKETEQEDITSLIGFNIIDKTFGKIGFLTNINLIPGNNILEIDYNGQILFIPYHPNIVDSIDLDNKSIYINAPEGLISIYI